ncbi:MAG: translation elongation factor Ts [Nitrospinales bacterium]|nr:translation elongation factor Ts [Nitrospinales bacterium]
MNIDAKIVKELRDKTGAGMMDCKRALVDTNGDLEKAVEALRKAGVAKAANKGTRSAKEGLVFSYIHHGGRLGVLVEVNCETDFVAKTDGFKELVHNLAIQIAATNPVSVSREQVPEELVKSEENIYTEQAKNSKKPDKVIEKIVSGKMEKFYEENCVLEQPFIKDTNITVQELIKQKIALLGENINIGRFVRFEV